jgi:A/G-specific adenine glycosylase
MSPQRITFSKFKKTIWDYYRAHLRSFRWREELDPYFVVVSEVMLQQTQAPRVVAKFDSFIKAFPDFDALASAPLRSVLREWQGLGYNRRGMNLKKLAEVITTRHNGHVPETAAELIELPGIGPHTAGSILAFAHNIAEPFIETNIRSVFIHFFFKGKSAVSDAEIRLLVEKTLDRLNPREWYWALMDYGVMLKKLHSNPSRKSAHYKTQSRFKGSNRELRSQILQMIIKKRKISEKSLVSTIKTDHKAEAILLNIADLEREGFIARRKDILSIKD